MNNYLNSRHSGSDHDPASVLLIDDDRLIQEAMGELLKLEGVDLIGATHGQAGVALFRQRQAEIGMVLLDVSLPGMSAEEVLDALQAVNRRVPIVLFSGHSESEIVSRFANKEIAGFLPKPYRIDYLFTLFRQMVKGGRQ